MQIAQKNFYKKLLGHAGEVKAAEFLKEKKYKILARNFRTRIGEIDIIAEDGDTVVFVEVKTRSDDSFGSPSEAVGYKKREKYFMVAEEYLLKEGRENAPCRFDVIEIRDGQINHIENAFFG